MARITHMPQDTVGEKPNSNSINVLAKCGLNSLNGFLSENRLSLHLHCCPETEDENWVAERSNRDSLLNPTQGVQRM